MFTQALPGSKWQTLNRPQVHLHYSAFILNSLEFLTRLFSPAGKHTASTHHLSALVTPAGQSYVCAAQQTLTLISSDHQKGITVSMYDVQIQPFDIASDFMFSEGKNMHPCIPMRNAAPTVMKTRNTSLSLSGGYCCSLRSAWLQGDKRNKEGGNERETKERQRDKEIRGGTSGLYECSHILYLSAAFIDLAVL